MNVEFLTERRSCYLVAKDYASKTGNRDGVLKARKRIKEINVKLRRIQKS